MDGHFKQMATAVVCAVATVIFTACGGLAPEQDTVTETNYMKIEGIYVDNAYRDTTMGENQNQSLRRVYVLYTAFTNGENLKISGSSINITVDGVNGYASHYIPGSCDYMSSYFYSSDAKLLYTGDTVKMAETLLIPEGELAAGKTLEFTKADLPETELLRMSTDDMVFCENAEQIAQMVDPEGYEKETTSLMMADEARAQQVRDEINGFQWEFYVNSISYQLEFYEPNGFTMTTLLGSNSGTYDIMNGYVAGTYDGKEYSFKIPYTFDENGNFDLDVVAGFDVSE